MSANHIQKPRLRRSIQKTSANSVKDSISAATLENAHPNSGYQCRDAYAEPDAEGDLVRGAVPVPSRTLLNILSRRPN